MPTLLDVMRQRFAADVDPDSEAGQILGSLSPRLPFGDNDLTGEADVAPLSFTPTADGIRIHAAGAEDALVFSLPAGPIAFSIVPPGNGHPFPLVELTLLELNLPLPFLHAAQPSADGMLEPVSGDVKLHLLNMMLIVTAGQPASTRLAPAQAAGGGIEVNIIPAFAFMGSGSTLGVGFGSAVFNLDGPGEPEITVPDVQIFVAPPGVSPLAMHGGVHNLRIGFGLNGGLSGDFTLALASGASAAARPDWLHELECEVKLDHSVVTLLRLTGQIDVENAIETHLGQPVEADKIKYTLSLSLEADRRESTLALTAANADQYLWRLSPSAPDLLRNTLGAYAVFAPLLTPSLPGAGTSGYVDLALGAGSALTLTGLGLVKTESVTVYGGELIVSNGSTPEGFLFFDVETELHITAKIGATTLLATRRPIKVRHRAIGVRLDFGSGSPQVSPVFDPARGFSLDLSDPGMFFIPGPLGDILQPEGARMARDNPLVFEVDLVLKANLGVVTIDRATVRIPIDSTDPPTITALGARIDVAGVITGGGYVRIADEKIEGQFDASLAPLGVRVGAGLAISKGDGPTGVLVILEAEFPIAIPLANSGLGIFGFAGLFAMHFTRNQTPQQSTLDWFTNTAQGNPTRLEAWNKPQKDQWAFGIGAVLGTLEGGFLLHVKGMLVIEVPGPRVLILMKANILSPRSPTRGTSMGQILAVIEITPDSILIGLVVDYTDMKPLLELRVPVEAYFNWSKADDWHLDIGALPPKLPVLVNFLLTYRAEGYLMLHGDGIPNFPLGPLEGFSVAAGVRVAIVWGPEPIGLYIKVTAQADIGISFKPFLLMGRISLSGELRLFIVGIEVSTSAIIKIFSDDAYYIHAEVCGKVEFVFFEVEGCVDLTLGEDVQADPPYEPLLRAVSLHSRSPAIVRGTGAGPAIDASLADAAEDGTGDLPVVPIDAIPVLQFEMRPAVDDLCKPFGQVLNPKPLMDNQWVRRGSRFYRYTLKNIEITGTDANGGPLASVVTPGDTPCRWWDRNLKGGDIQLALLTWIPDPTPAAAERTKHLDTRVKERWGTICSPAAPPAPVLWVFRPSLVGESASGWTLYGLAWPDPAGTIRSIPPHITLRVTELWRSANALANALSQVSPAFMLGASFFAERFLVAPYTGTIIRPLTDNAFIEEQFFSLRTESLDVFGDALRLDTDGMTRVRLLMFITDSRVFESGFLHLMAFDAGGTFLGLDLPIDGSFLVDAPPFDWTDAESPWAATVNAVMDAWFNIFEMLGAPPILLIETDLPDGTDFIEIGARESVEDFADIHTNYWGLLLVEATTVAEQFRFEVDEQNRSSTIEIVNGALGADESKRALLHPNATYTVKVDYSVGVADVDEHNKPAPLTFSGGSPFKLESQKFVFKTDDTAPDNLDPWILTTDPSDHENYFFYGDPLRVVFSTPAVRSLYETYGLKLYAVAKASSGSHPSSHIGFGSDHLIPNTIASELAGVVGAAFQPWEDTMHSVLDGELCITDVHEANRHERHTLKLDLQPNTNYVVDIEARSLTGSPLPLPEHPLFRRHFTTSRYASMLEMAADIFGTTVQHRYLDNINPLNALGVGQPDEAFIADFVFEQALREARWGRLARPDHPQITVIWQSRPTAILIETPEPLGRWRQFPQEETDAEGTRRYVLKPQLALSVVPAPGSNIVRQFITTTGGGRVLLLLHTNPPGTRVDLVLQRHTHELFGEVPVAPAPLLAVSLDKAPWEEA